MESVVANMNKELEEHNVSLQVWEVLYVSLYHNNFYKGFDEFGYAL